MGERIGDIASKRFVVGINYASEGCGRTVNPIAYTDKLSQNDVGQIKEYGIRALQSPKPTSMYLIAYRIPFLVEVTGTVKTKSGTGVSNVQVSYYHIDPNTGLIDENNNGAYAPVNFFTTDFFWQFWWRD